MRMVFLTALGGAPLPGLAHPLFLLLPFLGSHASVSLLWKTSLALLLTKCLLGQCFFENSRTGVWGGHLQFLSAWFWNDGGRPGQGMA